MATTDPQKPLKRLRKLNASEVSLVNRGAIRRPFLVIKNQEGTMPDNSAGIVPALPADHEARFEQLVRKRMAVKKDDLPTEDDTGVEDSTQDEALDERAMAALKAVYRILLPFKGQIPEDAVDDVLAELDLDDTGDDGQYAEEDATDEDGVPDEPQPEDDQAMAKSDFPDKFEKAADWSPTKADGTNDDDHIKAVAAAKDAYAKCIGKAADTDEEDEDEEDVKKSAVTKTALPALSVEHATLIAKAEAARSEAVQKAAALEERVAKMEDDAALKSYEEAIRRDCQVLGKDSLAQAKIVKSAYAANKEAGDAIVGLLKETANIHSQGIFKSHGTSNNAAFGAAGIPSEQGSAQQQMDAMLQGIVQKGEAADESAAWNAVMKTQRGQDLYNQIHGSKN